MWPARHSAQESPPRQCRQGISTRDQALGIEALGIETSGLRMCRKKRPSGRGRQANDRRSKPAANDRRDLSCRLATIRARRRADRAPGWSLANVAKASSKRTTSARPAGTEPPPAHVGGVDTEGTGRQAPTAWASGGCCKQRGQGIDTTEHPVSFGSPSLAAFTNHSPWLTIWARQSISDSASVTPRRAPASKCSGDLRS